MKLELIGHDEKYALEQSLLTLFPGEKPVYGTVDKTADTRWARVTLTEEDERVQVTTELGVSKASVYLARTRVGRVAKAETLCIENGLL